MKKNEMYMDIQNVTKHTDVLTPWLGCSPLCPGLAQGLEFLPAPHPDSALSCSHIRSGVLVCSLQTMGTLSTSPHCRENLILLSENLTF